MGPLEILRSVVVLLHLTGFAVLFGAWVAQAVGERRITRVMSYGLLLAVLAGLILAAPWPEGVELDYVKLGVKFAVIVAIGGVLGAGSARQRRNGTAPTALFWLIGILTFANAAIALLWR